MAFAQLTWRESLRDIADCLNARPSARYHLGFREPIARSTLADANEQRDGRLWPVFDTLEACKKQGSSIDAGLRAAGGGGFENVVQLLLPRSDFLLIAS